MPEPDVSVSRRPSTRAPDARDVVLLIEVSGSSLTKDRVIKNEIYAEAGVPEYWIVNWKNRTIEVLTKPSKRGYQRTVVKKIGDVIRPSKLRSVRFVLAEIPWSKPWDAEMERRRQKMLQRRRTRRS
jgi:Uma2 family endonuclease